MLVMIVMTMFNNNNHTTVIVTNNIKDKDNKHIPTIHKDINQHHDLLQMQLMFLQAYNLRLELLLNVDLAVDGDEDAVQRFTTLQILPRCLHRLLLQFDRLDNHLKIYIMNKKNKLQQPAATWVSQDYNPVHNSTQEEDQDTYPAQKTEEYAGHV